jgi:outer membrane protein assembly factor BamD
MFKKIAYITVILFVTVLVISCGQFHKIQKSTNLDEKYKAAEAYYLKNDYFHAQQLFDELINYYRGTAKGEKVAYYYAYCFYGINDYISASFYFKSFATTYPRSPYAREAQFMSAYCSYLESPDYSLDQSSTNDAIKELQFYTNSYPKSDSVLICNKLIDELRFKLEKKEFEVSKLYFKTQEYRAAVVSFKNTIKDYPESKYKEDCMYYIMKAWYLYASNSVEYKKPERYQNALDAYNSLLEVFPQTKYIKEADLIKKNTLKATDKYKSNKS